MSNLEEVLHLHCKSLDVEVYKKEYRFAANWVGLGVGVRKRLLNANLKDWRFDFAWPQYRIAAEVEGGTWINGRHTRGKGFERDCKKYNAATERGWLVLRFTAGMVKSGEAVQSIKRAIEFKKLGAL